MLPLSFWHEYLDMTFLFKIIHGQVNIDPDLIPRRRDSSRVTRSNSSSRPKFYIRRCKTSTFQKSYFNRSIRTWNFLADILIFDTPNLRTFQHSLIVDYYLPAVQYTYDPDDPRTWKTICLSCNRTHSLRNKLSCCF